MRGVRGLGALRLTLAAACATRVCFEIKILDSFDSFVIPRLLCHLCHSLDRQNIKKSWLLKIDVDDNWNKQQKQIFVTTWKFKLKFGLPISSHF